MKSQQVNECFICCLALVVCSGLFESSRISSFKHALIEQNYFWKHCICLDKGSLVFALCSVLMEAQIPGILGQAGSLGWGSSSNEQPVLGLNLQTHPSQAGCSKQSPSPSPELQGAGSSRNQGQPELWVNTALVFCVFWSVFFVFVYFFPSWIQISYEALDYWMNEET